MFDVWTMCRQMSTADGMRLGYLRVADTSSGERRRLLALMWLSRFETLCEEVLRRRQWKASVEGERAGNDIREFMLARGSSHLYN